MSPRREEKPAGEMKEEGTLREPRPDLCLHYPALITTAHPAIYEAFGVPSTGCQQHHLCSYALAVFQTVITKGSTTKTQKDFSTALGI